MKNLLMLFATVSVLAGTARAATYSRGAGSGDFTDWGTTTVTAADEIRFWPSGDNAPWIDGTPGAGVSTSFACAYLDIRNPLNATAHNTLVVKNGGELSVSGTMKFLSTPNDPGESWTRLLMDSGSSATLGTLSVGGYKESSVVTYLDVLDGSSVHVTGGSNIACSYSADNQNIFNFWASLRVVDSCWTNDNTLTMGNSYENVNKQGTYTLSLAATNSTFVFGKDFSIFHGKLVFKDCNVAFTGTSVDSSGSWQPGALLSPGRDSDVTFDGGTLSNAYLTVGNALAYGHPGPAHVRFRNGAYSLMTVVAGTATSDGSGVITVEDGAEVTYPATWDAFYLGRHGGTGVVEVTGGVLRSRGTTSSDARIASRDNAAYGRVTVSGGLWDHAPDNSTYSVLFGETGEGHFIVTGGEARLQGALIGGSGYASSFEQSGGLVKTAVSRGMTFKNGATCRLTGGELRTAKVVGTAGATTAFNSDGGFVRATMALSGTDDCFANFTTATLGAKGLTVDTDGYDVQASQVFTDATAGTGLFRKTGLGTFKTTAATWTVSKTVADGGTFEFGSSSATVATALVVTNGATVSFGDLASVSLSGLVASNATLVINPAVNRITVNGPVALDRLRVTFTAMPTTDQMNDVLTITGGADEASAKAWRRAVISNDLADGTHGASTTSSDRKTFAIGVKTDRPLTVSTVWQGASDGWSTESNWSVGVPAATNIATFGAGTALDSVTVPSAAVAGALAFSDRDYTLAGAALTVPSEEGSAAITVSSGSQAIDAPVVSDVSLAVDVAADAELSLSRTCEGGFSKTGYGTLALGADNAFFRPLSLKRGVLDVATANPFGADCAELRQYGGLLRFGETPAQLPQRLSTRADTSYTIVKTSADVSFDAWEVVSGVSLLKRGTGRLTLGIPYGTTSLPLTGTAKAPSNWWTIPEGDELPYYLKDSAKVYMTPVALTILEGELALQGADSTRQVTIPGSVYIGVVTKDGTAEPALTVRDMNLRFSDYLYVGIGASGSKPWDTFYRRPTLTVVDGTVKASDTIVGTFCYGIGAYPTINLTNAVFSSRNSLQLSQGNYGKVGAAAVYRAKDSRICYELEASSMTWMAGLDGDFDNCFLGQENGAEGRLSGFGRYTLGEAVFRNGTIFAIKALVKSEAFTQQARIVFDDATWRAGDNDLMISSAEVTPGYFTVETRNAGLKLPVEGSHTFTFGAAPLVGSGAFTKSGTGTVVFSNGMYRVTGRLVAEAGTVDLTNAGTITNAVLVAGAGTIRGGTFHNATLILEPFNSSAFQPFNFENCTFTGQTRVTIGGEPVKAADAVIANYTGTLAGVNTFKLKGWSGCRGSFTAKDGTVTVDIVRAGVVLLLR